MGVKPQKNPRYKLIVDKGGRRYRDVLTGQLLTRREFEKMTKSDQAKSLGNHDRSQPQPRKTLGQPGNTRSHDQANVTGHIGNSDQSDQGLGNIVMPGYSATEPVTVSDVLGAPVPVADIPEPPPILTGLNQAANLGGDVAKAAGQKTSDSLANIVGDALAMCLNLIADIKAAPDKRYLVVETNALAMVTKPAARIAARHLPVEIEAVGPDGQDAAELFKGVMYCVTAVWANKQVFDAEMRRREEEYAALFDQHYGPGSYARARAQAGGQAAGTGGPVPGPTGPGSQGVVSNGNPYAGAARTDANGSGNHRGDGGRTAAIIHQLYQQYPGTPGQPPGFGRAV